MVAIEHIYRIGKKVVGSLPPWMLRLRPYNVHSIPMTSDDLAVRAVNDTSCQHGDIRWATTAAERSVLTTIADHPNLVAWNGSTRRAAVAWRSFEPIGVAWIATRSFDEPQLGLHLELAHDEAWLHSAFVTPSCRKQGVYRELLEFTIHSLADEGFRRLLLGVTTGNEPSRRAHRAAGATKVGRIVAFRAAGMSISFAGGKVRCSSGRQVSVGRSIDLRIET